MNRFWSCLLYIFKCVYEAACFEMVTHLLYSAHHLGHQPYQSWVNLSSSCKLDSFRQTLSKVGKHPCALRNHHLPVASLTGVHPVHHQAVHQVRFDHISAAHPILPPLPLAVHLPCFSHVGQVICLWKLSSQFFAT